jgi:hypothetical protein
MGKNMLLDFTALTIDYRMLWLVEKNQKNDYELESIFLMDYIHSIVCKIEFIKANPKYKPAKKAGDIANVLAMGYKDNPKKFKKILTDIGLV